MTENYAASYKTLIWQYAYNVQLSAYWRPKGCRLNVYDWWDILKEEAMRINLELYNETI